MILNKDFFLSLSKKKTHFCGSNMLPIRIHSFIYSAVMTASCGHRARLQVHTTDVAPHPRHLQSSGEGGESEEVIFDGRSSYLMIRRNDKLLVGQREYHYLNICKGWGIHSKFGKFKIEKLFI